MKHIWRREIRETEQEKKERQKWKEKVVMERDKEIIVLIEIHSFKEIESWLLNGHCDQDIYNFKI